MKDYNLERYSDKVWQGGRKFGMEQAICDVLEIIDKRIEHNKPVCTLLQARAVSELNHVKHDILALKGGEHENSN